MSTEAQSVTAASPTPDNLLVTKPPAPQQGWQATAYRLTGGAWNAGPSDAERSHQELLAAVRRPLRGIRRVAVLSLKGGVGKTTTTVCVGETLASHRGDRVIAVDANPDAGTLAERVESDNDATIRDLLNADPATIDSYVRMREFTSQDSSRLEVLAGDEDPDISEALQAAEYKTVVTVLSRFYNIILTDCGTGLLHSAMSGILELADDILIIVGAEVGAARKASQTLNWLTAHGYADLVENSIAVISPATVGTIAGRDKPHIDIEALTEHFAGRCRTTIEIPADPHLGLGAEVDLNALQPTTRLAYLKLTAAIAERF